MKSKVRDGAVVGEIIKTSSQHMNLREKESKNIISQFSFAFGEKTFSHNYVCFDRKNFGS